MSPMLDSFTDDDGWVIYNVNKNDIRQVYRPQCLNRNEIGYGIKRAICLRNMHSLYAKLKAHTAHEVRTAIWAAQTATPPAPPKSPTQLCNLTWLDHQAAQ